MPLTSVSPRDSEGASTSGRRVTSASSPLTFEEREWTDVQENEGIMAAAP